MLAETDLQQYDIDRANEFIAHGNYRALTRAITSPVNKLCYIGFNHSTAGEVRQYLIQGLSMEVIAYKFAIPVSELEQHMAEYPMDFQRKFRIDYETAQEIAKVKKCENLTCRQVAARFEFTTTNVIDSLKRFGLWEREVIAYSNTLTREQAQEAFEKHKAGAGYKGLAKAYDCSRERFKELMLGYGLYDGQKPDRLSLAEAQAIMRKWEQGQSFQQQAAELHMGRNTLIDVLVGYGLYKRRPKSLARKGSK